MMPSRIKYFPLHNPPVRSDRVDKCGTSEITAQNSTDTRPKSLIAPIFVANRWRVFGLYSLFGAENSVRLILPWSFGMAIDGLLVDTFFWAVIFLIISVIHVVIACLRRVFDTRVYTRIYSDLAVNVIVRQRKQKVNVSRLSARSALCRECVDFVERDIPVLLASLFSIAGALLMLSLYDWLLVVLCVAFLVPIAITNVIYGRKCYRLNCLLNDRFEREVDAIDQGSEAQVSKHYSVLRFLRIRLSDLQAVNFSAMELITLGLMLVALVRACVLTTSVEPGYVYAIFRYLHMFTLALSSLPILLRQLGRLNDIRKRMQ